MADEAKKRRVALLQDFRLKLKRWFDGQYGPEGEDGLRIGINKLTAPAQALVVKAGCHKLMTISPPPAVGGLVAQNIDPFASIFTSFWGTSVIPDAIDMVDSAIGVIEDPYGMKDDDTTEPPAMADLSPLPVVLSALFEGTSDEAIELVSLCGLEVDWTLTKEQAYSNTTRKRVYRPRVDTELAKLTREAKLRIAWIITAELLQRRDDAMERLQERLRPIGWEVTQSGLSPSGAEVTELFFPSGSEYDAYVDIRRIITTAERSIDIADAYLDGSIFDLLSLLDDKSVHIRLLTKQVPTDFARELNRFTAQYSGLQIEFRTSRDFHDRFVLLDANQCYHLGASIKDAGKRSFMISKVESSDILVQSQATSLGKGGAVS